MGSKRGHGIEVGIGIGVAIAVVIRDNAWPSILRNGINCGHGAGYDPDSEPDPR